MKPNPISINQSIIKYRIPREYFSHTLILNDKSVLQFIPSFFPLPVMLVARVNDMLAALVHAMRPQAEDAARALLLRAAAAVAVGAAAACAVLGANRGHGLELRPYAGAAALALRPRVFRVCGARPVLAVLAVVDGGFVVELLAVSFGGLDGAVRIGGLLAWRGLSVRRASEGDEGMRSW